MSKFREETEINPINRNYHIILLDLFSSTLNLDSQRKHKIFPGQNWVETETELPLTCYHYLTVKKPLRFVQQKD